MVSRCTGGAGGQGVGYECNIAAVSCQEPPPAPAPGHLATWVQINHLELQMALVT